MRGFKKVLSKIGLNITAVALVLSITPSLMFSGDASAVSTAVIYGAIPDSLPSNMVSLGFQATQTSAFGDYVHLAGTDRNLDAVTVTMSNWALYADYATDARYLGDSANWYHPITINIFDNHLGANGVPDTLLATVTQIATIPWRPAEDPTHCPTKSDSGYAYKWQSTPGAPDTNCYNGFAVNITFDMSSLNITLPDDVIVGIAYNTQSYGLAPIGVGGPYNSLNVGLEGLTTVGTDNNSDNVFWNTSTADWYTDDGAGGVGTFREDTGWAPYVIPIQITANITDTTAPEVPVHLSPSDNSYKTTANQTIIDWTTVTDPSAPVTYRYQSSNLPNTNPDGSFVSPAYTSGLLTASQIPTSGTPQGVYYWHVKAVDAVGNESNWSDAWKVTVDNAAPTTPTVSFINPTLPCDAITNIHNVTVDWTDSTDNHGLAGYEYLVDYPLANGSGRGQWATTFTASQYTGSLNEGYHDVKVRAKDLAGNYSAWSNICRITADWTAPDVEITAPSNGSVSGTVEVRGTVLDSNLWRYYTVVLNSSNQQVAGPGTVNFNDAFTNKSLFSFNTTLLADGIYTIRLEARDKANNKDAGSTDVNTITVDNTAPTADLVFANIGPGAISFDVVFSEPVDPTEATNPANYFLNNWPGAGGTGDLIGDANISYNGATNTATVTFLNAGWYVSPEQNWGVQDVHDLAGNLLVPSPTSETSTPMVAPTTTAILDGTVGLNSTYVSDVTVDFSATDPAVGSGVIATYYNLDGSGYLQGNPVLVTTDGAHNICYYSTDNAGNTEAEKCDVTFSIDQTAPVITINPYGIDPTNQDVVVTASTNEGTLNFDSYTFTDNGSFEFVSTDAAGNVTTETVIITNIDKIAPVITVGPYSTSPTNQDIVVVVSTNEGSLNFDAYTFTTNGSFDFVSTDAAGNVTTETVIIDNIDKAAPVITLTGGNVTLTVGDTYTELGATSTEGTVVITGSVNTAVAGTYLVNYDATDEAGNNAATVTRTVQVNNPTFVPTAGAAFVTGALITPAPTAPIAETTPTPSVTETDSSQTGSETTEVQGSTANGDHWYALWWVWVLAALGVGGGLWFLIRRRVSEDS